MAKFFENEFPKSLVYFNEFVEGNEDYTVFEIDRANKRKMARPPLSVSQYIVTQLNKKLFFGSPNPLILIEDICDRLSLQELLDMFHSCVDQYYKYMEQSQVVPAMCPKDLLENMNNLALSKYADRLHSNLITYQASLFRKSTKLYKNTEIIVNNLLVDHVKKAAMDPEIKEFDEIFRKEQFYKTESLQDRLKKVSILSYLFSDEFKMYLEYGQGRSLMEQLWNGVYYQEDYDYEQEFQEINQPQRETLLKLFDEDTKRLRYEPPSGRSFIDSYDDCLKRLDQKCEKTYRFVINPYREKVQQLFIMKQIVQQVFRNIEDRESQGIDQKKARIALHNIMDDDKVMPQDIILIRELMIEANTQLGLLQLPEEIIDKYKELIKQVSYGHMKKMMGEDPRIAYKRKLIEGDNQNKRKVYTQLQDGSVPSFEEFKSIKDQIVRNNYGVGSNLSPIKYQDNVKKTTEQYMKLQEIAENNSQEKDRAKVMQKKLNRDYLPSSLAQQQSKLFIDERGNPVEEDELYASKTIVYSPSGAPIPLDISKKTVKELRDMGFNEITSFSIQGNPQTGIQPNITPEERENMRKALEEMKKDENDTDHFQDDLDFDFQPKDVKQREEEMIKQRAFKQKKIDQYRISVVYQALEKGVPLEDPLYHDAIETYSYYKKKFQQRQDEIKKAKIAMERAEAGEKIIKYKFEGQIKGKRNLSFLRKDISEQPSMIEVETTTNQQKQDQQDAYDYYENILKSYQRDQLEIQDMTKKIEEDVFTEKDVEREMKRYQKIEKEIERRLGNRYKATFEDNETGSTISKINEKNQGEFLIQNFFDNAKKIQEQYEQKEQEDTQDQGINQFKY